MSITGAGAEAGAPEAPPLILLIDDQESSIRAMESVLEQAGYAVLKTYNGRQGLERAASLRPDAVLLRIELPDMSGAEACRRLRADPRTGGLTPIIVTGAIPENRGQWLDAVIAGASDFIGVPPDVYELLAKLRTWIGAKRGAERAGAFGLLDSVTGVYNERGLIQRAQELMAEAKRYERPLACVVFELQDAAGNGFADTAGRIDTSLLKRTCDILGSTLRTSDALGRLSAVQFAVLAPATDAAGALRLARRALAAMDRAVGWKGVDMHAGCFGVADLAAVAVQPAELVARAAAALRNADLSDPAEPRVHSDPGDQPST